MANMSNENLQQAIIDMAVEAWRFRRVFDKAMSKLDAGDSTKYLGQFNWFIKKVDAALDTAGMRIVNVEGQLFDVGMAVTPLNIDEFGEDDTLYVHQMIEPIIMQDTAVVKIGSVILGKVEK